ncbi:MAG: hypothetical protein IKU29_07050 [Parabacteroides sp.]|nr:hypothetical protein [Parabacteroides sp.]
MIEEIKNISHNKNLYVENYIKTHYIDFYNKIVTKYNDDIVWREKLYLFVNGLESKPKCKVCGKPTYFVNFRRGYCTYCSNKCCNGDPDFRKKTAETNLKKYGHRCTLCNKDINDKARSTMMKRYGAEWAAQNQDILNRMMNTQIERHGGIGTASKSTLDKLQSTMIERYGNPHALQNVEFREKLKSTNREKYGVDYWIQADESKEQMVKSHNQTMINKHEDLIGYTEDGQWICKCPHPECDKCASKTYITYPQLYNDRKRDCTELCTNLAPFKECINKNTTTEIFIKLILDEYNIPYEANNHKMLGGQELDIYIPHMNIAFEGNGIYWHSTRNKPMSYHINKYKKCLAQNIQLIQVWEDWINTKPDIMKSIILSKLGIYNHKIGARSCSIQVISSQKANNFLNENHIQGAGKCNIAIGLLHNDELVSVMTFSKKSNNWELNRFCTKMMTTVVGGASKLFNYFIKTYNPSQVVSFSCNDISNGDLYKKLGFNCTSTINKSYWWVDRMYERYHRSTFTKKSIVNRGWMEGLNDNWTEKEVMYKKGYNQIYDSGQTKWVWDNKKETL